MMDGITVRVFEDITVELLLELASRPRPLSEVDRHSLDCAEAWLRRNTDGTRRESPPLEVVLGLGVELYLAAPPAPLLEIVSNKYKLVLLPEPA
jgi:hypothetical protein